MSVVNNEPKSLVLEYRVSVLVVLEGRKKNFMHVSVFGYLRYQYYGKHLVPQDNSTSDRVPYVRTDTTTYYYITLYST
jgi:hypothetical protein